MLAALVLPIDIVDNGGGITVKSALASHDKANDKGKGHIGGAGGAGGDVGGAGNPGSGHGGSGSANAEAADADDKALDEAIGAVEPAGPPSAGAVAAGLPTVQEIFALADDAVVGQEEERHLIADGWNAR